MVVVETHDYLLEVLQETAIHRLGFAFKFRKQFFHIVSVQQIENKKKKKPNPTDNNCFNLKSWSLFYCDHLTIHPLTPHKFLSSKECNI